MIAYKQPITAPEIMEIRGVQGASVLKTLLDRKLIGTAGRKQVIGKPILYKTTREFLVQFGLKDVGELPSLKEFQELARLDMENEELPQTEHPASSSQADPPNEPPPAFEDPPPGEEPPVEQPPIEEPPVHEQPGGEPPIEDAGAGQVE